MRKRKVTLTSTRKIISSEGDRREVVQGTRQVYVGGVDSTPKLPDSNLVTISTEETTDILVRKRISETLPDSHLQADGEERRKKPRHDQRIVDIVEEKESVSKENLVEKEMVTLKGNNDRDSNLKDVRIIVSRNGKTETEIHEEEMETEKNDGEFEGDLLEDGGVVNTDKEEVHSLESGSYNDIDDNDIVQKETEGNVENKLDDNDDEKVVLDDSVENTARNEEVKDDGGNESENLNKIENEQTNNEDKKDISNNSETYTKNGATDKVMEKRSNNVTETKSEEKPIEEKRQDTSVKTSDVINVDENKRSESDDSSDDDSGSESDSSDSSSSSSGSSSSSRSSSSSSSSSSSGGSSRDGSGTGSASDSEDDKKSGSRSRSASVSSSSYSYSTGGSTEKKDTLRSVVAQTSQSSKPQQRRSSRSPTSRSRDRRYSRNRAAKVTLKINKNRKYSKLHARNPIACSRSEQF